MVYQFLYIMQGLVNLYKLDKSYCAQHIAAEKGCSISYRSRNSHSRAEAAEVRRKKGHKKIMQGERDKDAVQGPPDKSSHFKSTPKRFHMY